MKYEIKIANPPVYIIDDDREVRTSIVVLLKARKISSVPFLCAEDFLEALAHVDPGCILVDVRMQSMSGIDLLRALQRQDCHWPSAVITGHGDVSLAVESLKLGAMEFLQKPFSEDELLATIEEGFRLLPDRVARSRQARAARKVLSSLTPRERQVFDGIVAGGTNKEIAQHLQISPRTVESYRLQMMIKIGATKVQELWAISKYIRDEPCA